MVGASPGVGGAVSWAYGGTLEAGGSETVGTIQLVYSDHSNYAVLIEERTTNGSTIHLNLTRILATSGWFIACTPNCAAPLYEMQASSHGTEFESAQLVLSSSAAVDAAGTSQPALGLLGESLNLSGNLSVAFSWANRTNAAAPLQEWFNASSLANTTGTFSARTALGLVPTHPIPGSSWNSSAVVDANATTLFAGATGYQGNIVPSNHSEFAGTSIPISPSTLSINGTDRGNSTLPGLSDDRVIALDPSGGGASLLEGMVLVPTSAYLFAGFDSGCDLGQRPCVAIASTPELDFNATATSHLGWDAAVSSVSAFAMRFDPGALGDLPDGAPFWPAGSLPSASTGGAILPAAPLPNTVLGVPIPVSQALALQQAYHPPVIHPTPGNQTGPPPTTSQYPPAGSGPLGAPIPPASLPRIPGFGSDLGRVLDGLLGAVALGVLGAGGLAVRRRRARSDEAERDGPGEEPPPEDGASGNDPMGYVW